MDMVDLKCRMEQFMKADSHLGEHMEKERCKMHKESFTWAISSLTKRMASGSRKTRKAIITRESSKTECILASVP